MFNVPAMDMAGGDFQKADYILDCSYWEFHYRLEQFNAWNKREKEKYDKITAKSKAKGKGK